MQSRLTCMTPEVADQFGDFIIERAEQTQDVVRAKTRDFSMLSLLKLLYQLRGSPMSFVELYTRSEIRMKRSFLNYLHLCVDYNFVKREAVGCRVKYSITRRGRTMLNLFTQKDN